MILKRAKTTSLISFLLLLAAAALSSCSGGQGSAEPTPTATTPPLPTDTPQPTPTQAPVEVAVVKDLLYASGIESTAGDRRLDIYYLPGSDEQKPVVIWTHGYSGNRRHDSSLFKSLAEEGFVVLSIGWLDRTVIRNSPENLREATEDVACALRFAAENTEQYGGDPNNVIWAGFSAGAWIGSIISFADGNLKVEWDAYAATNDGPAQQVECYATAEPAHVKGFVGNSGSYYGDFWLDDPIIDDWTAAFLPLQMISAVGNNPGLKVRIIHGRSDALSETPFEAAERFATALDDAGYDVEFLPQEGTHEVFKDSVMEQIQSLGE